MGMVSDLVAAWLTCVVQLFALAVIACIVNTDKAWTVALRLFQAAAILFAGGLFVATSVATVASIAELFI